MLAQKGWIQKGVRRTRVDQRLNGNRRLAGNKDVDQQGEVTGGGVGERDRKRKSAAQPLAGTIIFWKGGCVIGSVGGRGDWGMGGGGADVQGPGNGPWKGG